ncbi:hypothetical protein EKO04_006397 [Ascochyta lentis]|uniref:SHSP domain-containing protein n=1 Tax=Ascochyta lentis TaxID=205686 RepID=A0A8H7J4V1_9PLEO|nr:hypothetical protein EKO04_006397 [Ascochyta lentis]
MASSNPFNYMNNNPVSFWDYLASLEQQGNNHPFFGQNRSDEAERGENDNGQQSPPFDPWGWGHQFFGGGRGMPHRGPPPPGPHGPPPHHDEQAHHEHDGEKDGEKSDNDNGEGPSGSGSDNEGGHSHGYGRHGRCGSRRGRHGPGGRGGFGPHHGPRGHHGPPHDGPGHRGPHGPHHGHHGNHSFRGHHGPPHHGGQRMQGPWGNGTFGGPCRGFEGFGAGFNTSAGAKQFFESLCAGSNTSAGARQFFETLMGNQASHGSGNDDTPVASKDNEDFTPEADMFDTLSSYVIHVSLPGAKKEDVGVNWDAEKSELSVAGVIYRPGDEELLKTLSMKERNVGPFERKIRLGSRANPARVDVDGITAKLEDGILRVEVRKEDEGFVEIKKVEVE